MGKKTSSRVRRLTLLAASILLAGAVQAQEAVHALSLPSQPLDQALNALAGQTGSRILFATDIAEGLGAPALSGELTVKQALERLLYGSGLRVEEAGDSVFVVASAPATAVVDLGAISIQGQGMGEMTENSGFYTTGRISVGSKTPTSLRETPQSVSVITEQMIKDKQITRLGDAMKLTPGITVKNVRPRMYQFSSRGFPIDTVQIDGTAPMDLGTGDFSFYAGQVFDFAEFDHVEVLRGAGGLLTGVGDPGGVINLVRKRPLEEFQLKLTASAGSWDNYRSEVDVTGPIAFDGNLRGRLVTAYTDRQYFMDGRSTERPFLYGVLEADISPLTRVTVGGRYERIHENGTGDGLPRYSDGRDLKLSRSIWFTSPWAYSDGRAQELFAKIDHEFSQNLKLNISYTNMRESIDELTAFSDGAVNAVTGAGPVWWGSYYSSWNKQSVWDANISGKFTVLEREHEFLLGMDWQDITSQWRGTNGMMSGRGGPVDVFNPGSTPWLPGNLNKDFWRDYDPNSQEQYGLYSTLRLQLTEPLKLITGARVARYKFEQIYRTRSSGVWSMVSGTDHREPTKVVPFGGLVYALDDQWSTYMSYSEIFKPQAQRQRGPLPGSSLEPMTGKTYETGVKGELWGGDLNLSAAMYYTEREDEATLDSRYPRTSVLYGGSCCYLAQGKVTSKGIDLEASGEVLPKLMLIAGYTYNRNENRSDSSVFSSITPKHQFKLWSTYELSGDLSNWKVGGGVNVQSANYVSGTASVLDSAGGYLRSEPYEYSQGGYAVWDAMVEYTVDENWSLTLNGNNIFDRKYYETMGSSGGSNYYGEPRSYMLTLRGVFN